MIYEGSRYEDENGIYDEQANVTRLPIRRKSYDKELYSKVYYHIWVSGDNFSRLAHEYYGDATKYWILLDANPHLKGDPTNVEPGMALVIPQEG
nr:MAG TPA: LysM domain/BON superfamily protein [Caudoviricetes sp.]